MSFGQPSGPPASAKQVQQLLALLQAAGHTDFRDARGPLGFTQRQAAGKFTRSEAEAFIEQLQAAEHRGETISVAANEPALRPFPKSGQKATLTATEVLLRELPSEQLAAELQRRGWGVVQP